MHLLLKDCEKDISARGALSNFGHEAYGRSYHRTKSSRVGYSVERFRADASDVRYSKSGLFYGYSRPSDVLAIEMYSMLMPVKENGQLEVEGFGNLDRLTIAHRDLDAPWIFSGGLKEVYGTPSGPFPPNMRLGPTCDIGEAI